MNNHPLGLPEKQTKWLITELRKCIRAGLPRSGAFGYEYRWHLRALIDSSDICFSCRHICESCKARCGYGFEAQIRVDINIHAIGHACGEDQAERHGNQRKLGYRRANVTLKRVAQ